MCDEIGNKKEAKFKSPIFDCFKFACLGNLTISPQPQDTIGPYVKSERLSSCSGYEYGGDKKYASIKINYVFETSLTILAASHTHLESIQLRRLIGMGSCLFNVVLTTVTKRTPP